MKPFKVKVRSNSGNASGEHSTTHTREHFELRYELYADLPDHHCEHLWHAPTGDMHSMHSELGA